MGNMASMIFKGSEFDYLVAINSTATPSDSEWNEYCRLASDYLRDNGDTRLHGITITLGGGPSAAQRKRVSDIIKGIRGRAAVVADSRLVRGIVTALTWITKAEMRAYTFPEFGSGLSYVGLHADERAHVLSLLSALEMDYGIEGKPVRRMLQASRDVRVGLDASGKKPVNTHG